MAAATAVTSQDRPQGRFQQFTFTLASASVAAAAAEVNTIAVPGAVATDAVIITPITPAIQAGLIVCNARVSAAGVVTFNIVNATAGALTPAPTSYICTLVRGTTQAFAR